jgi:eukaryotic-like serine/threonine-protein kinase
MNERVESLQNLLLEALEIQDAAPRAAFLDQACAGDAALRQEIEELLEAESAAGKFLPEQPALRAAQTILQGAAAALTRPADSQLVGTLEQPGDRIGRYRLLQRIGEGGCGVVYMADQEEPVRRKVALKVVKLGMDTKQVVARFDAERQALALMDHPNIAKVLDAGATEAGRPFFVMELVRGVKITDYCDQNEVDTRQRLELFIQVCQAVQHAHQKGVIHRDLKPSNILVTVNDGVPVPKVIDFGIAKATAGKLTDRTLFTAFEQFLGTPAYMSPEQAVLTSLDIDTRSDIYSLGVLLYELLTGTTPFETKALLAAGLDEMRRTIRETEPPRPSTRLTSMAEGELSARARHRGVEAPRLIHLMRGDLDWIAMKCLEKDRARRYETANGLAADVRRHLRSEPVIARPPSRFYEFQKTVRRHTFGFAAAGVVMAALAVGAVVSALEARRALRAEWEQAHLRQAAVAAENGARREAYARAMLLGYEALQSRDYGLVRELLEQTRAFAIADEGTNARPRTEAWEWRHLAYETRDESAFRLAPRPGVVQALTASPDGQWLAAGDSTGLVSVWRLPGRDLQAQWPMGTNTVCLAFSPDSRRLAVGCQDGTVRVLGLASGERIVELHEPGEILYLCFSAEGHRLAIGSVGNVCIAEVENGRIERSAPLPPAWRAAISPDLQTIVRSLEPEGLAFYRAGTNLVFSEVAGNRFHGYGNRISPDGRWLATPLADHSVQIWSMADLRPVGRLLGHTKVVDAIAWSADSRLLAGGGGDQITCIWEVARGTVLRRLRGHDNAVEAVAFSADGRTLFSGGGDTIVRGWTSLESEPRLDAVPLLPATEVVALASGGRFLSTEGKSGARIFETYPQWSFSDFAQASYLLGLSGDGRWLAGVDADRKQLGLWLRDTNRFVFAASHPEIRNMSSPPVFSRDGHRLGLVRADGSVEVYDLDPWRLAARWTGAETWSSLLFDPPGNRLFIRSFNKGAAVANVESGRWMPFLETHQDPDHHLSALDVSADNRLVATSDYRGRVSLWACAPGEEPRLSKVLTRSREGAWAVAFSPNGQDLAVGTFYGNIELWDLRHEMLLSVLKGHRQTIWALAFNLEDDSLVSVSPDEVRVWRVGRGG